MVGIKTAPIEFPQGKCPTRAVVAVSKRLDGLKSVMQDG